MIGWLLVAPISPRASSARGCRSLVGLRRRPTRSTDDLHTLALVDRLTFEDLAACAPLCRGWRRAGARGAAAARAATSSCARWTSFRSSTATSSRATSCSSATTRSPAWRSHEHDLRRACELQAKSHLIHLREGFLESGGDAARHRAADQLRRRQRFAALLAQPRARSTTAPPRAPALDAGPRWQRECASARRRTTHRRSVSAARALHRRGRTALARSRCAGRHE